MRPKLTKQLYLPDGRVVLLDYNTDAATLRWVLQNNLAKYGTDTYAHVKRIIYKRYNTGIPEFLTAQTGIELPDLEAKEYLENLPEEAYDKQMWAHPLFWAVHNWTDSGTNLRPWVPEKPGLKNDLEAAVYLRIKKLDTMEDKVNSWIHLNLHLTPEAFDALFIQTRLLHDFNYFSRSGSEAIVCRVRKDVQQLIIDNETWLNKMESALIQNHEDMASINTVLKNYELAALISQAERVLRSWQMLKTTQVLRVHRRQKKTGKRTPVSM